MEEKQYVIMFNDFPEAVCAAGTTKEQAEACAETIKMDYLISNPSVNAIRIHVRATDVRVIRS